MRAIAWLRRNPLEAAWAVFAAANWVAMVVWPSWETIPFHFVWISLTLVYGFRVWSPRVTAGVLGLVVLATGASIFQDAFDGLQILRELQRSKPELPVVILSARGDVQTKLRGFELGASDYVAKPFSLDELLARVRVRLRGTASFGDEHVLRGGNVVLDVARRQAGVGDRTADLSDREFRLLHHLLVHVGEVVSRERLLAEVWGYDFDPGSNVVDVCIRRLRRKLGPGAPIETVRNAGYRLVAP